MLEDMLRHISRQQEQIIEWQRAMTALPAMGPENGGQGEKEKALYLEDVLHAFALSVLRVNAPDPRVESGQRPNLVARLPGRSPRTLWVLGHMDVVPPGDPAMWNSDPWEIKVEGDRIYGRGVEDNQQAIVSALLMVKALRELDLTPDLSLGLMFVADEETGNTYGIKQVLESRADLFGVDDLVIAPDYGVSTGEQMCISEKSMIWLKVTVTGHQGHAARPALARNALTAASRMILRVQEALEQAFPATDPLFEAAPASTFTPTKHETNVPNVNTIPGKDVFYLDCRVLAAYELSDVLSVARSTLEDVAAECGVTVAVEVVQSHAAAPGAPLNSLLVTRLAEGIRRVYQVEARPIGSGGGTVAGAVRENGLTAVAWSKVTPTYHEPNEFSSIANTIGDAQVMATILFDVGEDALGKD